MNRTTLALLITFTCATFWLSTSCSSQEQTAQLVSTEWPEIQKEHKPWSYWWWMGNAVDKKNITGLLEQYQQAGLGGMHIVPIYGVKGEEHRFIDYLSPKWIEMLNHTITEAARLEMGVDMTSGTGWNFGGPQVALEDAVSQVILKTFDLKSGQNIDEPLLVKDGLDPDRNRKPQTIMAYSNQGKISDVTENLDSKGKLDWKAPQGQWKVYAVFNAGIRGAVVERASPGGKGYMVNPFSEEAMAGYLEYFDKAFSENNAKIVRAFYHDSYEYHHASWSKDFLNRFQVRRGYDLRLHLPTLFGDGPDDKVARIRYDFRRTIAELHREYIKHWTSWAKQKGALTRNQAHGSPTNLIDTYAAADIPETEIFHHSDFTIPGLTYHSEHSDKPNVNMIKFASSAAHIAGKNLISSESCTWLDEHFKVSLAQVKPEIDQLFIAGINHVFYHGIAYSPLDEEWPGWLFYASTNFDRTNSFFRDFPYLNQYIARCQSILQSGKPDNDILLYYPVHDMWNRVPGVNKRFGDLVMPTQVHYIHDWLVNSSFYKQAEKLTAEGFSFDYLSDQFLLRSTVSEKSILTENQKYQTIIIPESRYIPVASLQKLLDLAKEGAQIIFEKQLPEDVPGHADFENRRLLLEEVKQQLKFKDGNAPGLRIATHGDGDIILADNVESALSMIQVPQELLVKTGLKYIRRSFSGGNHYFITSLGNHSVDGWITLGKPAQSAVIMNPMSGKIGLAAIRQTKDQKSEVYLQLQPGESLILRTFGNTAVGAEQWNYSHPQSNEIAVKGEWQVEFMEGGPELPQSFATKELVSWTESGDKEARRFAGTAKYSIQLELPEMDSDDWLLDLGKVAESARIYINGKNAGVLFAHPFQMRIGEYLKPGMNVLEIEVTNLSANRIRDLEIRKVNWKKFYDINYVNIYYRTFDASGWEVLDSGLLGPVKLIPVEYISMGK